MLPVMPPDDDDRVSAWAALLRAHAAVVPRLERELAAVGMPLSWYDVLLELNSAPDRRLRMTELGARAVLSRERVSRVVDELERAGLARRERNPDDGRSLLAVLTDEGRAAAADAAARLNADLFDTLELTETEAQSLFRLLARLR